jgi:glycosyltransferase involved in cell wall biosynthesis
MNVFAQETKRVIKQTYMLSRCYTTSKPRVAISSRKTPYVRTIYDQLKAHLYEIDMIPHPSFLQATNLYHLHWPEWALSRDCADLSKHQQLISALNRNNIPIVWTQHNLIPHSKNDSYQSIYQSWAKAADVVIHHSLWGQQVARSHYTYSSDCQHVMIPHPRWNWQTRAEKAHNRVAIEKEFGFKPCAIRLGIVGRPRQEKDITGFIQAFADCSRTDLQLVVWSLKPGDQVPDDPRIYAKPYKHVSPNVYNKQIAVIDVLVMPFSKHTMLATGTVADAVALGIPCLISNWPYLSEHLGEAAISYGAGHDSLVDCLESLNQETLDRASLATHLLQEKYAPDRIANLTWDVMRKFL